MNKVLVVGSINVDQILTLDEFPTKGETISTNSVKHLLGGKGANQAVSAARLGAQVTMIGCVGDNLNGASVLKRLENESINTSGIQKVNVETGSAIVMVHNSDNRIIIHPGANQELDIPWIEQNIHLIDQVDVVLMQFEIPMHVIEFVSEYASRKGKMVIINPAPAMEVSSNLMANASILTPNETEFSKMFGSSDQSLMSKVFREHPNKIIVTLGDKGIAYSSETGKMIQYTAHKVDVIDTTGAGDTFNGALAFALSNKYSFDDAIKLANKASSISIQSLGAQTGMPTMNQLKMG